MSEIKAYNITCLNLFEVKAKEGKSPVNLLFLNRLSGLNVGSFPIILRFDSLGWYYLFLVKVLTNFFEKIYKISTLQERKKHC